MLRTVSATLETRVEESATVVLSVALARQHQTRWEVLRALCNGQELETDVYTDAHGTRLHCFEVPRGEFSVHYEAGVGEESAEPETTALDLIHYLRPSRYCESDLLGATATDTFGNVKGAEAVLAVRQWVNRRLSYLPGTSRYTDGAVQTLLHSQGVCRDYAHLVIALLRGLDIPARFTSVYAPGLEPMDFHAVAEAFVDGRWWLVDATSLAPRRAMLRIASGRDAADTAFLSHTGTLDFRFLQVQAEAEQLPPEDPSELVSLR